MIISSLTPSRVLCYLHCPYKYYQRYCEKTTCPPNAALLTGIVFHQTVGTDFKQKLITHKNLPTADVLDIYSTDFDMHDAEFRDQDPGQVKDEGINVLELYHTTRAQTIQPRDVEASFAVNFKGIAWNLQGKVDLIGDDLRVIETKTTSRGLSKPKQDHLIQVSAYTSVMRKYQETDQIRTVIDYCIKKKAPEIKSFSVEITDNDWGYFLSLLSSVAHGIETETWPANRIDNYCSRRHCDYWQQCEAENQGRVRD